MAMTHRCVSDARIVRVSPEDIDEPYRVPSRLNEGVSSEGCLALRETIAAERGCRYMSAFLQGASLPGLLQGRTFSGFRPGQRGMPRRSRGLVKGS
jgi:hypothetical protein